MKTTHDNNTLTLYLAGRIDANNAPNIEAEIAQELAKFPGLIPAFDASELEYISSAGLRVLLKFRKGFGKNLDVLNVSSDVFDIFEVTGFTQLLNVRKKFREVSIEGCPVIGEGHFSTVYRLDNETIIKVFNKSPVSLEKIQQDQKIAREAFVLGIPTAISYDVVKVGGHYGIVYEMVNADTLSSIVNKHPELMAELSRKAGKLLRQLHHTEFKPGILPDILTTWRGTITTLQEHELLSAEEAGSLHAMLDRIPSRNTFIHYDFHGGNILVQGDELILIDVGDASLGYPAVDLACVYLFAELVPPVLARDGKKLQDLIGVSAEMMADYWRGLTSAYFETTDHAKLKAYHESVRPYGVFRLLNGLTNRAAANNAFDKMRPEILEILSLMRELQDSLQPIDGI